MKYDIVPFLALMFVGCATSTTPDLFTYREGLNTLNQPIYDQTSTLTTQAVAVGTAYSAASANPNDPTLKTNLQAAVKAVVRTPNQLDIVNREITEAKNFYTTSKNHDSATTQTPTVTVGP